MIVHVRVDELLLVTDVSTAWAEVVSRVKWIVLASRLCYKSSPLKVISQFSRDGIAFKTRVKFVNSRWSVRVSFDPCIVSQIKSVCLSSVLSFVLNKSF